VVRAHDVNYGQITCVSFSHDKKALISASKDGTILVKTVDYEGLLKTFRREYNEGFE
jgi:hypothetical protein